MNAPRVEAGPGSAQPADRESILARRRALGLRLKQRSDELLELLEQRSGSVEPTGSLDVLDAKVIRRQAATSGTAMTIDWLVDGVAPSPEAFGYAAQIGAEAAAANYISLTEVLRSTLCWRDTVVEILSQEATRIGGVDDILRETVAGIHMSVDSYLVTATRHFDSRIQELSRDLGHSYETMAHEASHDTLTGLANRTELIRQLGETLARPGYLPLSAGVLFLDLDHFKELNDSFGHRFGDQVLVAVGRRLSHAVRPMDLAARFGGDEFVVLCTVLEQAARAEMLAGRISQAISQPVVIEGRTVQLSVSTGICLAAESDNRPEAIVDRADAAMYAAKEAGRGRYEMYSA